MRSMSKTVCLALDVSTKTGWSVLEQNTETKEITLKEYGVEKLPLSVKEYGVYPWNYLNASRALGEQLLNLIIKTNPDVIVIEEINKGKNRFSQKLLDFLHNQLLVSLDKYRQDRLVPPVFYINSSEWRKKLKLSLSKSDKENNKLVKKATACNVKKSELGVKGKIGKKHLSVRYVNQRWGLNLKIGENDIADSLCQNEAFLLGAETCNGT